MRKLLMMVVPLMATLIAVALISCMKPEPVGAQAQEEKPAVPTADDADVDKDCPVVAQAGEEKSEKEPAPAEKEQAPKPEAGAEKAEPGSFFDRSLHATGEGMRFWYEEQGGFKQLTGIPYKDLSCKECHVDSCDKCHAEKKDDVMVFTVAKAKKNETCHQCHARASATMQFDQKAGVQDVHFAMGMTCASCHKGTDVHGDGKSYKYMREPGAVKVSCTSKDCHDKLDKTKIYHKVHKNNQKVHCNACHVSSTITCMNCHFDSFLREKEKKGNFHPGKSWTLLVNHDGKVTTGGVQTLVAKGKKFVVYAPYFTHSVVKKGRNCSACHGAQAAQEMAKGNSVEMARFANGKVSHYEGLVPFVPDLMKWPWLEKQEDGTWKEVEGDEKPLIQKAAGVEPLTEDQLRDLKKSISDR